MAKKNKHIVHDGEAFEQMTSGMSSVGKAIVFIVGVIVSLLLIMAGNGFKL